MRQVVDVNAAGCPNKNDRPVWRNIVWATDHSGAGKTAPIIDRATELDSRTMLPGKRDESRSTRAGPIDSNPGISQVISLFDQEWLCKMSPTIVCTPDRERG